MPTEAEWEDLYLEYLPKVYNYFRYRVGDNAVAEDLTATAFEKAWRNRGRYRADRGAFSTWLFTLARNVGNDYFRCRSPEIILERPPESAERESIEEIVAARESHARLSVLLANLSGREQELVALKYGAGLTNREIARLTGLSETNVGTMLHRIVSRLREQWEEPDGRR